MPEQMIVNTTDYEIRRAREELAGWAGSLDAKRPTAWCQYGYPDTVTFAQLRSAYERGGAGHGAVHRLLDKCWLQRPRIKKPGDDEESDWEKKVTKLISDIRGWAKLRDFDRRNMVGRYAALIYRVADGKKLNEPLEQGTKLVDIVPLFEDQIKVTAWHSDQTDAENFGKPKMYQYRARRPGSTGDDQGKPDKMVDVHPSRVQILAEGSVGDMFEGVPLLLAGYNALVDIEKLAGGGAENALKNSARAVTINFDATASPQVLTQNPDGTPTGKTVKEVVAESVDKLNRNIDAALVTQGAEANTLQTIVGDLGPQFEICANLFAASVQIPFTILFGQQTGRLASDEDKADFASRCGSRQTNELTPMLEEFVRRMQACGIFEAGEFEIEWAPVDAPDDDSKATLLGKYTAAMQQAFNAGLTEPIFDANELRRVVGFEEREDDGMPQEGDDPTGADPNADPAIDPKADPNADPKGARPRVVASR